jgi:hypothetical protein
MNYMQNMRICTIVEQFKKSYLIEYFQWCVTYVLNVLCIICYMYV